MIFENARNILRMGSTTSSLKLLVLTASFSHPRYRALCLQLLRPFARDGEVELRYRCYGRDTRCLVRLTDIESDVRSVLELVIRDAYDIDRNFRPDLVIDGGGNIGLFTIRAAAAVASAGDRSTMFVVCEPLRRNIEQIKKNMKLNEIPAEIMAGCLGGTRRTIPFYCREAINSSFDSSEPYTSVMDMPVRTLQDAIGSCPAERILIKLDIEGMEIEVLESFVPAEQRAVYVVGELHGYSANSSTLAKIFQNYGWAFEYVQIEDDHALFRACSPAAVARLSWAQHSATETVTQRG
jgi:FkbM family methyltransferase